MEQNNKLNVKDIVTTAAMMVLFFAMSFGVGMGLVPFPIIYLYGAAGIQMFIGAIFYLVAANRINKHGLLFIWATVYGIITALMGYVFMLPYFIGVGIVAELTMIGKDAYITPKRNMIGWATYGAGMIIGNGVPIWTAWDTYKQMADTSGYSDQGLRMTIDMVTKPHLLLLAIVITAICAVLGVMFAQKLLQRHFKKAGIIQ